MIPSQTMNRSLEFSFRMYQRLLAAYPRPHREEYGVAMAQLFRDQCRDAWEESRTLGLIALWLRTLPDLLKTSFIERCSHFKPGKYMVNRFSFFFRPRRSPTSAFITVSIVVFLLVLAATTAVTFMLPESYASTARIKVEPDEAAIEPATGQSSSNSSVYDPFFQQTTFELIQSQVVLSNVVNALNLNVVWGEKYYGGKVLKTTECMDILKRRMDLKTIRNTKLISITVYSDDRNECATLANAIAKFYQDYRQAVHWNRETNYLASLQTSYRQQESNIDQLQADKDALAQKYGIHENWEESRKLYESQLLEGTRAYQQLKTQLDSLLALSQEKLVDVLPTITEDSALSDLLGKLNLAQQQRSTLKIDYAPSDLHMQRVDSTIAELHHEIDLRVAGIMTALTAGVDAKQANLKTLQAAIDNAQLNSKPTPENQPYWDKKHELELALDFRDAIGAKLEATRLRPPGSSDLLVEITDFAEPAIVPIKPNKLLNITWGAIIGVFLGVGAGTISALFVEWNSRRKRMPRTV